MSIEFLQKQNSSSKSPNNFYTHLKILVYLRIYISDQFRILKSFRNSTKINFFSIKSLLNSSSLLSQLCPVSVGPFLGEYWVKVRQVETVVEWMDGWEMRRVACLGRDSALRFIIPGVKVGRKQTRILVSNHTTKYVFKS